MFGCSRVALGVVLYGGMLTTLVWNGFLAESVARPWATPGHTCLCPYKYGKSAAVGPQSTSSVWKEACKRWSRVAPSLALWCAAGFQDFHRKGRALRSMLPLGGSRGSILHLYVLYGDQGAGGDSYALELTDALMQAALQGARVCVSGQLFVFVGD